MNHIPILMETLNIIDKKNEGFSLPPFEDTLGDPEMTMPPELVKYKINYREFYDVIDDFDTPAIKLTDNKKVLRKKYLNIILSIMDEHKDRIKDEIKNGIESNNLPNGMNLLANFDASFNTVKRIINLLIMEIDMKNYIHSSSCPSEKGYKIATIVLGIILLIISITIGTMFIYRFMS